MTGSYEKFVLNLPYKTGFLLQNSYIRNEEIKLMNSKIKIKKQTTKLKTINKKPINQWWFSEVQCVNEIPLKNDGK